MVTAGKSPGHVGNEDFNLCRESLWSCILLWVPYSGQLPGLHSIITPRARKLPESYSVFIERRSAAHNCILRFLRTSHIQPPSSQFQRHRMCHRIRLPSVDMRRAEQLDISNLIARKISTFQRKIRQYIRIDSLQCAMIPTIRCANIATGISSGWKPLEY